MLTLFKCLSPTITGTCFEIELVNSILFEYASLISNDRLQSHEAILVPKMLYLFEDYSMIDFKRATLKSITKCHLDCLLATNESIKLQSLISLPKFITNQEIMEEFEDQLEFILSVYIKMMEHNNDDIIYSFQDILFSYSYCIQPYVMQIIDQINDKIVVLGNQSVYGWLNILSIVLEAVEYDVKMMAEIDSKIYNILNFIIQGDIEDKIELILDCMASIFRSLNDVTNCIATYLPFLLHTVHAQNNFLKPGIGYFRYKKMSNFVWEIISSDIKLIYKTLEDKDWLFDIINQTMLLILHLCQRNPTTIEAMAAFKIMKNLLEHSTDELDNLLPEYVEILSNAIKWDNPNEFQKLEFTEIFDKCLKYNTELTFEITQKLDKNVSMQSFLNHEKIIEIEDPLNDTMGKL